MSQQQGYLLPTTALTRSQRLAVKPKHNVFAPHCPCCSGYVSVILLDVHPQEHSAQCSVGWSRKRSCAANTSAVSRSAATGSVLACISVWVPRQMPFLLKSATDRQIVITLAGRWQRFYSTWLKWTCHFWVNNLTDKIWVLKQKWASWKTCVLHPELERSQHLRISG